MDKVIVACMQPRLTVVGSRDEFDTLARRFMRQAQVKAAKLTVFPEFMGLMLAPPLFSGLRRGVIRRADQGRQPGAGFLARRLGRVADATAGAFGGGLAGSLARLLEKNSDGLRDAYLETFGNLAREYGTAIVGGSLYVHDHESGTVRNRAYLFDASGQVVGYQDKLNLAPEERAWAVPATDLSAFTLDFGRVGILIGQDALYPELGRLLAVQGVDLMVGIAAAAGPSEAGLLRSAMALRAEENQLFAAISFLLGPNYLDEREDYCGQSALLAPAALSPRGDGILVQAGSNRAESLFASELPAEALHTLRHSGRFRPRQEMNLGSLGPVLAEMYDRGLSIDQAVEEQIAGPVEPTVAVTPLPDEPPAPVQETPLPTAEAELALPMAETSAMEVEEPEPPTPEPEPPASPTDTLSGSPA